MLFMILMRLKRYKRRESESVGKGTHTHTHTGKKLSSSNSLFRLKLAYFSGFISRRLYFGARTSMRIHISLLLPSRPFILSSRSSQSFRPDFTAKYPFYICLVDKSPETKHRGEEKSTKI